jgi:7-cyano-7-deazaguanine synthase in queuosine biosynthesis
MFFKKMILKPSNIEYNISDHFPPLSTGKAGVALSGGLESTLIARIALDTYGPNNVVLLYSDNMFTQCRPDGNINVKVNVTNAENLLGYPVQYVPIDIALHTTDKISSSDKIARWLLENWNVEFTMWGFTKLFFDVAEFKEDPTSTHETIIARCYSDPIKYKSIIEEFHLPTGVFTEYVKDLDIPGDVYSMLRKSSSIKRPFDTLNKSEVIDLYRQLNYLDLAYKTHSCVTNTIRNNHTHCGICFNCQQRYDAFAKLGLEDKTKYAHDNVNRAWKELQKKLQE